MKPFLSLGLLVLALAGCMNSNRPHRLDPATAESDAANDISAGRVRIYLARAFAPYAPGVPQSLWYLTKQAEIVELQTTCILGEASSDLGIAYGLIYNRVMIIHLLELNGMSERDLDEEIKKTHK